jgi:hypothetical protein
LPEPVPVDLPVDANLLAEQAEEALKSTGEENTGGDVPTIEFYYGKAKKNGRTIKTGKVYWIYTRYDENGQRYRLSPNKVAGKKIKGITSIENCPFKGRVQEFYWRSLRFKSTGGTNTGGTDHDGRLQGAERSSPSELADT